MLIVLIFAVAFVLSLFPLLWLGLRSYRQYRGKGVLTCPETDKPVAVELDAKRLARTGLTGDPELRLQSCSRWPERSGCGQECLLEVEASPEDCLVRTHLTRWYEGSRCALCGREIGEIHWGDHRPALMAPDRRTLEWDEVAPETLREVLATHSRVCWDCHMAESFRARHPDLVIDDPLHRAERRENVN